jgi:hypothetical protein
MLKFSIQEPPPLVYGSRSLSNSTTAIVQLELESTNSADVQKSLQRLSFTVCSLLRAKTFYSVKSVPMLPGKSLLDDDSEAHLHIASWRLGRGLLEMSYGVYRYDLLGDPATSNTGYSF